MRTESCLASVELSNQSSSQINGNFRQEIVKRREAEKSMAISDDIEGFHVLNLLLSSSTASYAGHHYEKKRIRKYDHDAPRQSSLSSSSANNRYDDHHQPSGLLDNGLSTAGRNALSRNGITAYSFIL